MNDQLKAGAIITAQKGTHIGRKIRLAVAMSCLTIAGALSALWVSSYNSADRIHGRFWGRDSFLISSKQGRITVVTFRWHGASDWWKWGIHSFAVDDEMSFPVGSVRQYEKAVGFGTITNPMYMVMRSTFETPEGATILISGAAVATLRGSGVIVPYWFLVLAAGLLGIALLRERPWRYTTRSLLIAITLVAVVLGLSVGLDNRPDPWTLDIPAPLDEL
ncbi:MAG TPA: hypothetical protein VJ828_04720 [Lacipirellulaceae bacterium]|nr:hypothetical protein [Lacipirellulaceae bacterium]